MNNAINDLITLSQIFKKGYTVNVNNGSITPYACSNKRYIVSYKTLIKIHDNKPVFYNINHMPVKYIAGSWLNTVDNAVYIELNRAFKHKLDAIKYAKKHKQLAIYDFKLKKVTYL